MRPHLICFLVGVAVDCVVDDFCQTSLPLEPHPEPQAARSRSAVLTLAMCAPGQSFGSERGLYRDAQRYLWAAFPQVPTREQLRTPARLHATGDRKSVV